MSQRRYNSLFGEMRQIFNIPCKPATGVFRSILIVYRILIHYFYRSGFLSLLYSIVSNPGVGLVIVDYFPFSANVLI